MELIVRHRDRTEKVSVDRAGEGRGFRVQVGDVVYTVDAARAGRLLHSLRIDGGQYEVAVDPLDDRRYRVSSRRGAAEVEVDSPLTHFAREATAGSSARGKARVTAMMPGRVVALLAKEGAEVTAGQGILVLEAMKMENEILADRDGVVRHLFVTQGQSVEGGEPLFEIE